MGLCVYSWTGTREWSWRRPRKQGGEELELGPAVGANSLRWVSATDSELHGDILTLSLKKERGGGTEEPEDAHLIGKPAEI